MKLYDENMPAPNPRRVRIFLAEKGITIPLVNVSLAKAEHKAPDFLTKNSLGQIPVLELDDGSTISETVSICRYLEALHPTPALFGTTPKEIGLIDMWIRRVELQLMSQIGNVWINSHKYTEKYAEKYGIKRFPDFGEESAKRAVGRLHWLDGDIAGRDFIAGDTYSMADIAALTVIDFAGFIGIPIPERCDNLKAWHERVSARPSAQA
ncbi:FtsZ-localized protein A [Alphaproteobacteria bacterium SO-S41]|nr:FtsZ-localized protein A [Alphaproteobacteria bacterium SO-S41]